MWGPPREQVRDISAEASQGGGFHPHLAAQDQLGSVWIERRTETGAWGPSIAWRLGRKGGTRKRDQECLLSEVG